MGVRFLFQFDLHSNGNYKMYSLLYFKNVA